jgi:NADH dehydrogenase FAD-containing subunit
MHRVVIVGGGFGGLYCAKSLRRNKGVEVVVVDRRIEGKIKGTEVAPFHYVDRGSLAVIGRANGARG